MGKQYLIHLEFLQIQLVPMPLNGSTDTYVCIGDITPLKHIIVVHSILDDAIVVYSWLKNLIVLFE